MSESGPFTLRIDFNDGTSQTIDFRPVLKGDLYGPLQEPSLFDLREREHTLRTFQARITFVSALTAFGLAVMGSMDYA
ncbi:MAG TPA: hypothetical protein VLA17_14755 [Candidatus Limnocylindria bacterium]|nr:hypothetical protein [Candidatus Limnocylindria bacterium]